jgi:RHS repeat-associated protein
MGPVNRTASKSSGEPTAYPVADLDMDGQVTSADLTAWTDLKAGGSSASAYGLDLDFDDYYGPGEADEDLFWESYDANLGLSGKGRVSTLGVASRVGYAGYQWDQVARAYHVRYRVYLPEIGRWTRRDPLGYVDGGNLFAYVRGRPSKYLDPLGLGKVCYRPMPTPLIQLPQVIIPMPWYQFPGDELEPPHWWPDDVSTPGYVPGIVVPSWLMRWWWRPLYPLLAPLQWWPEHEHIYFEDGGDPPDLGFFPDGVRSERPGAPKPGLCTRVGLDDGVLRAAARYCGQFVGSFCTPGTYDLIKNNCQDFVACVLRRYDELMAQRSSTWGVPWILRPLCR